MMSEIITDKTGRKIQLRRVGVLEQLRLFKALGPELSLNDPYMDLAIIAASVSMIDNIPLLFPVDESTVEAILERLGCDGVAAVDAALPAPSQTMVVNEAGN
jgi:hypothetical protein